MIPNNQPSQPIPIALIAPALSLRLGLQALLSADLSLSVVLEAGSIEELDSESLPVTVLLAAGRASSDPGLERLLQKNPGLSLLLLIEEPVTADFILRFNTTAWGILSLDSTADELSAAVRALHHGLWVGDPALTSRLFVDPEPAFPGVVNEEFENLTPREMQVLQQLALGLANKQIGMALKMSENTVKYHVSAIYTKLGASNRAEAVRIGARRGLISL